MKFLAGTFALLSVGLLSGCFDEPNEMAILDDTEVVIPLLTERIEAREDLSYFAAVLKGARMDAEVVDEKTDIARPVTINFWNTLSGYGTYTLFAPNNKAVQEWLSDEFPQIDRTSPATVQSGIAALEDDDMLKVSNVIQYHICNDTIPSKLFVMGKFPYPTLLGSYLLLSKEQAQLDGDAEPRAYTVFNKTAYMVGADINAGNGYLHVL
ncbi:MAG: fasciclin domain-containing protein, partial [Bacteroidales bacterium]|nr:fasciclin domain-containing protein [Bacteroidales bacterium]